ncbi:terminase [Mycolicibacterium fortuitum]|uniref:terminase n=1 Tax=Mycolicibacterium fortuitum TaxID=1766 RepID=UPI0034CF548E
MIPEGIVTSVFPRVQRRLESVGVEFDRWQQGLGTAALGCRADGKYAATVGGAVASICRQTGKTYTVGGIQVGLCLEFPGFRSVWTSHHNRTTTNTFRSIQGLVRRKGIAPFIAPNGIRTANGEQEIRFTNGSIMMFGAREQGFGRGMDAIDSEVFDEAQILTLKALEDMVPATNQARNPHGGLIWFIGTPPRPSDDGEAFAAKREQAISGKSKNIFYVELSADPESDPDDQEQWPIMNPSFPHRTPLEAMLRMRESIPDDDSWNREARGIWPAVSRHVPIVPPGVWRELASSGPADGPPAAIGVDMSHRGDISIAACWTRGGFPPHVEEIWGGADMPAAVEFLAQAASGIEVLIDAMSPAAQMIPTLQGMGFRVRRTSASDMGNACLLFETRANYEDLDGLTYRDPQGRLSSALKDAVKRPIGDAGKWGIDRRDSAAMIYPLVAAVLALLGAEGAEQRTGEAFFL